MISPDISIDFFMDIKYKRDAMHSTDSIIANGADIAYAEK